MNIVFVLTYVVKYEKRTEFQILVKRFLKFKRENPKAFEGLKSWRLFQQEYGGVAGSYVEMWEYKSLEGLDKVNPRMMKHKEMIEIHTEFHKVIDHTTLRSQYGTRLRNLEISKNDRSILYQSF